MVINIKSYSQQENMEIKLFTSACGFLVLATIFFGLRQKPGLLIKALYPFETDHSPIYEIVAFIQIYSESYFFAIIIATDGMVIALIRWTTIHFTALAANYKNCNSKLIKRATIVSINETWELANQYNSSKLSPEDLEIKSFVAFEKHESENSVDDFNWRYKTCIKHHQRLLKLTIDVNITINLLLLLQFSASLTIVCLCGFQIILNLNNSFRVMQFAVFVLIALGELFVFCWYGNEFTHVTNSLTYNQWSSGWEYINDSTNSDKKQKLHNLITITMLQTMHPIEFKAVGLFVLSTATFLSVVKSSYSVLALLMNMND
ncbi:hypothetical protein KQX54_019764 [Cotesia glomerata]|uniref:Odorant receptor n=2 Tax=Cotesia glomerata TaxID=32391 RepID=A0AAV7J949_COTGL|nr:hypothetical protein KQX54_019764 [Cotesia glomerata]